MREKENIKPPIKMRKLKSIIIFLFFLFTATVYSQTPILYFDFESNSFRNVFENSVEQSVNLINNNLFTRNSGSNYFGSQGAGFYNSGAERGMAILSYDWSMSLTDPGTSAAKYYTFKINTTGFKNISLNFDYSTFDNNFNTIGVSSIGLLYSTNGGVNFLSAGIFSVPINPNIWMNYNKDLTPLTSLNNNSEIIFRIYAYGAKSASASFFIVDNVTIFANEIISNSNEVDLLSETDYYTAKTSGITNYVYERINLSIGAGTVTTLSGMYYYSGTFSVDGTLICPDASSYILGESTTSTFNLNANATLQIGDPDGISTSGILGNINTTIRNFSQDANYIYSQFPAKNNKPKSTCKSCEVQTVNNAIKSDNKSTDKKIKKVNKTQKDFSCPVTGDGIPSTIKTLTVNVPENFGLSKSVSVNNSLTMTSGRILLDSYNLTINANAVISGAFSNTTMIATTGNGELRKVFNSTGSFLFPVGDVNVQAHYSPVNLTFTQGIFNNNYIGVRVENQKHPQNFSVNDYLKRAWFLSNSGITNFVYNVSMQYLATDVNGTESALAFGKYYNGSWVYLGPANPVNHTLNGSGILTFSSFSAGEQGQMPVELTSFTSSVNGKDVKLNWTTATENNNSGFEIYRAGKDENNWVKIGFVKGNGTKNSPSNYTYEDKKLNTGKYTYKLKQIDFNGNYTYYTLNGTVEIGVPSKFQLSPNYPNPFNPVTKIDYELPLDSKVSIKVFDITGKEISTLVNGTQKAGSYTLTFNGSNLSSGIYFCIMQAESNGKITVLNTKMSLIK
jgi:hypothetical protein